MITNRCCPKATLLDFVSSLDEGVVVYASQKDFEALPNVSKAISELTILKCVGPATASVVLAAYVLDVVPFMSDESSIALSLQQENRPKQTGTTARNATSYMEYLKEIEFKTQDGESSLSDNLKVVCCLYLQNFHTVRIVVHQLHPDVMTDLSRHLRLMLLATCQRIGRLTD